MVFYCLWPIWGGGQQRRALGWGIRIRSVSAIVKRSRRYYPKNNEQALHRYSCCSSRYWHFTPSSTGSHQDALKLMNLVEKTGTTVSINSNTFDKNCIDKAGYYSYVKDKIDVLIVCEDQVNIKNAVELWETVSHEAVHAAQACNGGTYFKAKYHPRMLRELRSLALHYAIQLMGYRGDHQLKELEAFWAELQTPETVIEMVETACFDV